MIHIVTNNPRVLASYPGAKWVLGEPMDVLSECRRRVHEGYPLLSHPLMGDIHLLANPFRTGILGDKKKHVDILSLQWIEESIEKIHSVALKPKGKDAFDDYQVIDFELVRAVIAKPVA
ncbi:MAG: GrdX family protein [Thermodesulfobacteriota bacterium]